MQTRDVIIHKLERFLTRWIYCQNQHDMNLCLFAIWDLIRRKHVCGLKLLNANVILLPCGGNVEGDITLKLLHMYGFGYGFLTTQYHLDLPVGGSRNISPFQVIYLKSVMRYIVSESHGET
jgi:hypothetical protein